MCYRRSFFFFLIILFVFCTHFNCQKPQYLWTKGVHGSSGEWVRLIHTDLYGNVYFTGDFQGTADLDPGAGVINVTAPTNSTVVFMCKINPTGQLLWAKWIEVPGCEVTSICTDNTGNVYLGGRFMGQADFDPSAATFHLTGPANLTYTQFLWKLDLNGNFVNAGAFGGGTGTAGPIVKFNGQQNLYCTTPLEGIRDLDPGPGISTYTSTASSLNQNVCLLKLDMNLNMQWAGQFKSTYNGFIYDFEFDQAKNLLLSLWVGGTGTLDIDPGSAVFPFAHSAFGDAIVLKLAPGGSLVWHQAFSVANNNSRLLLEHVELDASQHVYLAGRASGIVDMDPGSSSQIMTTMPYPQVKPVVIRLDATGNYVNYDSLGVFTHVFKVNRDTLFFAGGFQGAPDFDPSASNYPVASQGGTDCYLYALDNSFDLLWIHTFGGLSNEQLTGIAFSNSHEVYVCGAFSLTADFDPGPASNTITAQAGYDGFLSKFSPCPDMPFNGSANLVCAGQSATLTSLNSSPVTWYQNSIGGNAIGTGSAFTTPSLTAGTATFFAASASCSLMPRTAFVAFVNALPTITVSGPTKTICTGQSFTLSATGVQSYSWTGGPVNASYSVSPVQTSAYTVVGQDSTTLCKNATNITVTVSVCSDLRELAIHEILIFPNPSDGVFMVNVAQSGYAVITDVWGRTQYRLELINGNNPVDISSLAPGMYFLSTGSDRSRQTSIVLSK
jgi:hypothetical protein